MALPPFPSLTTPGAVLKGRWTANAGVPSSGSSVTTWSDQSGNGKDFTAGVSPTFYSQRWARGRALLQWDGTDNLTVAGSGSYFSFLCDGSAFTVFIVWRTRQLNPNSIYTLLDTGGWLGDGLFLAYDNFNVADGLRLSVRNGSSTIVANTITSAVPYRRCHNTCMTFDQATYTFYEWGGLLGTTPAGAGYSGASAGVLTLGQTTTGNANPFNGDIAELIIVSGALNAADLAAINAYLECVWHPAGNWTSEYFLDGSVSGASGQSNVYAVSGPKNQVQPLVKYSGNPILTGGTWDHDMTEGTAVQWGPNDWGWYTWVADASGAFGNCYYTSTSSNGLSGWTRPNLGQVTYGGNTNNNLLAMGGVAADNYLIGNFLHNPNGLSGQVNLVSFNIITGVSATYCAVGGANDRVTFTLLKNTGYQSGDVDAGAMMIRADTRLANVGENENFGPPNGRTTAMAITDTNDVSGGWPSTGNIDKQIIVGNLNNQYYAPNVQALGDNWINLSSMYNPTSQGGDDKVHIDLLQSRDEGWSWIVCQARYIDNGSGWDSGTIFSANFIYTSPNYTCFYQGGTGLHGTPAGQRNSAFGAALVAAGRMAAMTGLGSVTLRAVYQPGAFPTVNAGLAGFKMTAACLDANGAAIAGYDDSQSTVASGDTTGTTMSWGGKGLPSQVTRLRFTMTH